MNLEELRRKAQNLKDTNHPPAFSFHQSLRAKAIQRWNYFVSSQVVSILSDYEDQDEESLKTSIQRFLATCFDISQHSLVSYTASPNAEATNILVELAETFFPQNPLLALMPTVLQESFHDSYLNLSELNIRQILKTHILSNNARYLYPVKQILDMPLNESFSPINPYYDFTQTNDNGYLLQDELQKLIHHSEYTTQLHARKIDYEELLSNQSSLLAKLHALISQLSMNSVGRQGTEQNAGVGVYHALIIFRTSYDNLSETQKSQIPQGLKMQIELLLSHAFNTEANARAGIGLCIATHKSYLTNYMRGYETILAQIDTGGNHQHHLIEQATSNFNEAKSLLESQFSQNQYTGEEKLGVSRKLIHSLDIEVQLNGLSDLNDIISGFFDTELQEFLSETSIQSQLTGLLWWQASITNLLIDTPEHKLPHVLPAISTHIFGSFFSTSHQLSQLLEVLSDEKVDILCNTLKPEILRRVSNLHDFLSLYTPLELNKKMIVFQAVGHHIRTYVNTINALHQLLGTIPTETQATILQNFMPLSNFIHDYQDVSTLFNTPDVRAHFLRNDAVRSKMQTLMDNLDSFLWVKRSIWSHHLPAFYEFALPFLPNIIHTKEDLENIMSLIPKEQHGELLALIQKKNDKLFASIKTTQTQPTDTVDHIETNDAPKIDEKKPSIPSSQPLEIPTVIPVIKKIPKSDSPPAYSNSVSPQLSLKLIFRHHIKNAVNSLFTPTGHGFLGRCSIILKGLFFPLTLILAGIKSLIDYMTRRPISENTYQTILAAIPKMTDQQIKICANTIINAYPKPQSESSKKLLQSLFNRANGIDNSLDTQRKALIGFFSAPHNNGKKMQHVVADAVFKCRS